MSSITITKNNVSRFNKRLQKALENEFSQKIPLNLASKIFSNTLGTQSEHELKILLEKEEKQVSINLNNPFELQALIDELINYFKETTQTNLLRIDILNTNDNNIGPSINIVGKSIKYDDIESFGLFFIDNPNVYLSKNLSNLDCTPQDIQFFQYFCKKYFTEDLATNLYIGSRLINILKIKNNSSYLIFKNNKYDFFNIPNAGLYTEHFLIVSNNYFEIIGTPYALNGNEWCYINKKNYSIYSNIETALKHMKPDELIIQCCISIDEQKPNLGSFFIYYEHGQKFGKNVSSSNPFEIKDINDFYSFKGYLAGLKKYLINNPYSINEIEYEFWEKGKNLAKKNLLEIKQNFKTQR